MPTDVGSGPTDPGSNPGPATRKDSFSNLLMSIKHEVVNQGLKSNLR